MTAWGETQIATRKDRIKEPIAGVKVLSGRADLRVLSCTLSCVRTDQCCRRERAMADLAYALLLIVSFLVLGLTVRGLEKL